MGLLRIVAKVSLVREADMENIETNERQGIDTPLVWKWRSTAIRTEDIMKIVAYNKTKSLIVTYNDVPILVDESFVSLFNRWDMAVKEEQGVGIGNIEGEEIEHTEEENEGETEGEVDE